MKKEKELPLPFFFNFLSSPCFISMMTYLQYSLFNVSQNPLFFFPCTYFYAKKVRVLSLICLYFEVCGLKNIYFRKMYVEEYVIYLGRTKE